MKKALLTVLVVFLALIWAQSAFAAKADRYVIKRGDTLWGISKKYGTTVKKLARMNPQITCVDLIYAGKTLRVPAKKISSDQVRINFLNKENQSLRNELAKVKKELQAQKAESTSVSKNYADMKTRIADLESVRIKLIVALLVVVIFLVILILVARIFLFAPLRSSGVTFNRRGEQSIIVLTHGRVPPPDV